MEINSFLEKTFFSFIIIEAQSKISKVNDRKTNYKF